MKKKFLLSLSAAVLVASTASAQLRVCGNGHLQIGKPTYQTGSGQFPENGPAKAVGISLNDSVAELTLFANTTFGNGAQIAFGNEGAVKVGEFSNSTGRMLQLHGLDGILYTAGTDTVFRYTNNSSSNTFDFNTDVRAKGVVLYSDARLKQDVTEINAGHSLAEVTPVAYSLSNGGKMQAKGASDRLRYGFLAQEIKELFPDLVVTDADGTMGVDYIGFIPLLVNEVKSLRAEIEDMKSPEEVIPVEKLRNAAPAGISDVEGITVSKLYQNKPNPFTASTEIRCDIPESTADACIYVYDLQGAQVMKQEVEGRGKASVTIKGESLRAGMYVYALVVDGEAIDSKRMILTD